MKLHFARVNKYTIALNKQELRRADFPGDFLDLSEELATVEFFDESRIFSAVARRRMNDVEFCSELLAALLEGPQNKTETLDIFYSEYAKWDRKSKSIFRQAFTENLDDITKIFGCARTPLHKSRFRQKADFYCLFIAIYEIRKSGWSLNDKDLVPLCKDIDLLDTFIAPESRIKVMQEYAIKCVSQANTINSRTWRKNLLKNILLGTYSQTIPGEQTRRQYMEILMELPSAFSEQAESIHCFICKKAFLDPEQIVIVWPREAKAFQISNAELLHRKCCDKHFDKWLCEE